MKILITGAAGYLGQELYKLLDTECFVIGMDNYLYNQKPVEGVFHADITSLPHMYDLTRGVDIVVALAGIVGDPACGLDEEMTKIVNVESTKLLVDVCETNKVKELIFASSCSVYGASDEIITEKSKLNPLSLYAQSKLDSEKIILDRCKTCQPTILRFGTLFGYSSRMRFDLVVNIMTAMAVKEGKIIVNGGDQWRPLVHVSDVARVIAENFVKCKTVFKDKPIFNVVSENYRIKDIATIISNITDAKIIEKADVMDKRNYKVFSDRWNYEVTLEKGVKELVYYLERGKFDDFKNDKYYNVKILQNLST